MTERQSQPGATAGRCRRAERSCSRETRVSRATFLKGAAGCPWDWGQPGPLLSAAGARGRFERQAGLRRGRSASPIRAAEPRKTLNPTARRHADRRESYPGPLRPARARERRPQHQPRGSRSTGFPTRTRRSGRSSSGPASPSTTARPSAPRTSSSRFTRWRSRRARLCRSSANIRLGELKAINATTFAHPVDAARCEPKGELRLLQHLDHAERRDQLQAARSGTGPFQVPVLHARTAERLS